MAETEDRVPHPNPDFLDEAALRDAAGRLGAHKLVAVQRDPQAATVAAVLQRGLAGAVGPHGLTGMDMVETIVGLAVAFYLRACHDFALHAGNRSRQPDEDLTGWTDGHWVNFHIPYRGYYISIEGNDSAGAHDLLVRSSMMVFQPNDAGKLTDVSGQFLVGEEGERWINGALLETVMARIVAATPDYQPPADDQPEAGA